MTPTHHRDIEAHHGRIADTDHGNGVLPDGNGPGHREIWILDPDGYTVVVASPDGESYEPA